MKVFLVRHADADADIPEGLGDEARALTAKARQIIAVHFSGLADRIGAPTLVLTSPLVRAVQTASILSFTLGYEGPLRAHRSLLPDMPVGDRQPDYHVGKGLQVLGPGDDEDGRTVVVDPVGDAHLLLDQFEERDPFGNAELLGGLPAVLAAQESVTFTADWGDIYAMCNSDGQLMELALAPDVMSTYTYRELTDRLNSVFEALRKEAQADFDQNYDGGVVG